MNEEDYVIFEVEGSGAFPVDMLRYDGCWPYREEDATVMKESGLRRVMMQAANPAAPTDGRWASFRWVVIRK
jgi:hypothetical protein